MSSTAVDTLSGKLVDYCDPHPESIDIKDISCGLSGESRFYNQIETPYSVAQHSLMVASLVRREYQLEALLHDAPEAYTRDIPRPLKRLLGTPLKTIEERLEWAIFYRFKVRSTPESKSRVRRADDIALSVEYRDLKPNGLEWIKRNELPPPPPELKIRLMSREEVERAFLEKFHELTEGRERAPC